MSQNYAQVLRTSERVAWELDAVLAADTHFDFGQSFLPEALAGAEALPFLDSDEQRALNHIRAHGYLGTFGLVEEFILPFILDRLRARVEADLTETRALLAFASEEAKHIALFHRFRTCFQRGFGHRCELIGPPSAIAAHVLDHSPLAVGLLILHIEWMTQAHYLAMVRGNEALEPHFRSLLHQHWLEECQHARIDGWIVTEVAGAASADERSRAFSEYVALLAFLDDGLATQVDLDLRTFQTAIGRTLDSEQRAQFLRVQHTAQRRTYLGSGVTHPQVRACIQRMSPAGIAKLDELARVYS